MDGEQSLGWSQNSSLTQPFQTSEGSPFTSRRNSRNLSGVAMG